MHPIARAPPTCPHVLTAGPADQAESVDRSTAALDAEMAGKALFRGLRVEAPLVATDCLGCRNRGRLRSPPFRVGKANEPRPTWLLELGQDLAPALLTDLDLLGLVLPIQACWAVVYALHTLYMACLHVLCMGDTHAFTAYAACG